MTARWTSRGISRGCGVIAALLLMLGSISGCGGDGEEPNEVVRTEGTKIDPNPQSQEEMATAAKAEQPFGLRAQIDVQSRQVEGSLEGVAFEAQAEGGTGAVARLWWEGDTESVLVVTIEGPATGSMTWKGVRLDGYGALTAAEQGALEDLEQALPAMTVARIALDLACQEETGELPAAVGAALVMPTQMSLKYRTPSSAIGEAIARMAAQSECQHGRKPLDTIDPERVPAPGFVALSDEAPIPMASGYFPFDGEGGR